MRNFFKTILVTCLCAYAPVMASAADLTSKSGQVLAQPMQKAVIDDLTLVISSCGKYSDLWAPVCSLLFKYWPSLKTYNKNVKIVLITTDKEFSFEGVRVFHVERDKGWSANMLAALKTIDTKYVMYLQEDYLMSQPVNETRIKELLDAMKKGLAVHVELNRDNFFKDCPPHPTLPGVLVKGKHQGYRTSNQAVLWNKETFEWLINPEEDPWKFEMNGSVRSEGMREPFLAVGKDFPMQFVNACNLGFWDMGSLEFLKKEGFEVKNTILPRAEDYPFTRWLQHIVQLHPRLSFIYKNWTSFLSLFDDKFKKAVPTKAEMKARPV